MVELRFICLFCGTMHSVQVLEESYDMWRFGALTQEAFPYLTAEEREQIISGICPECQKDTFGKEDED